MAKGVSKYHVKQMEEIFESLNHNMFRKLEEADHIMVRIAYEAGLCGVPVDYRAQYMKEKLIDMIEQIAENRGEK